MQKIVFWVGIGLLAFFLRECIPLLVSRDIPTDFRSFYLACEAFLKGGNFYDFDVIRSLGAGHRIPGRVFPYLYPPVFATLASPLAHLGPHAAKQLWIVLSAALGFGIVTLCISGCLSSTLGREEGERLPALILGLCGPFPGHEGRRVETARAGFPAHRLLGRRECELSTLLQANGCHQSRRSDVAQPLRPPRDLCHRNAPAAPRAGRLCNSGQRPELPERRQLMGGSR